MAAKFLIFVFLFFILVKPVKAQLKFVVEDFEGFTDGSADFKINGVFTFGNCKASVDKKKITQQVNTNPDYFGERYITVKKELNKGFAGWGKGVGLNIELDATQDYLNFYVYQPIEKGNTNIKIQLQEDDNDNAIYEKEFDDSWIFNQEIKNSSKANWQLVSIPLNKFKDDNKGGDGVFNCTYKKGKLFCVIITFIDSIHPAKAEQTWSFDFICFSKGALSSAPHPVAAPDEFCNLGIWSQEGNLGNFTEIASAFENIFKADSKKKLGVVHFFQPFAVDGVNTQNHYPSVERINKVIEQGNIPMITLENHFVNADSKMKQPNLYSIIEGHLDGFFINWAKQIKQVKGTVLLRILHEFNGNWYPWCVANNDKNPELLIKAFWHIHDIFNAQQVTNVKFIWCPNSMSVPQEKWNFIMDAYPGDAYVDYVGMDIYNGAGQKFPIWVSFRKVGIENYFILTQQLPGKPLLVCETASIERENHKSKSSQTKAEWIMQQSEAIKSDMSKIKLLTWFNENGTFKINSSEEAKNAFLKYIIKDDYFKSGVKYMNTIIK